MKRIAYEEIGRIYDYTSKEEAEKHAQEMKRKGWRLVEQYDIDDNKYKYTQGFTKTGGALC